ncbi:YaaA family protein [Agromyces lapidis]|uniref:YaaA family protein n=1 Tax=Agromyces lapidis TaxID=279574 RepID=A0ABV5SQX1_9MICO|nr:peroxide stress protein YaaA [Agromyces lapidis]
MRILLPPSETKRDGGADAPLALDALSFPTLSGSREQTIAALGALSTDGDAMMRALKLGPRQVPEVERNRRLAVAPTMAAIDRYTGVLFDALDAPSLDAAARRFAGRTVVVHSALLGLVGALDPIPAYRLSHDSKLPGLRLKSHWRSPIAEVLDSESGLIVDLRSEGYAELGPAPVRPGSVYVRVVSLDGAGRKRALNHFNKQAKGRFTRAVLEGRPELESIDDLLGWADSAGFSMHLGEDRGEALPREIELVA